MNDDDLCSKQDLEKLKVFSLANGRIRCDLCYNCKPQAGYDVPHCSAKGGTERNVYKLTHENIPFDCIWFIRKDVKDQELAIVQARKDIEDAQERFRKLLEED